MEIPHKHTRASEHERCNCDICASNRYVYSGIIWVPKWFSASKKCQCCQTEQEAKGQEKRRKVAEFWYFITAGPALLVISIVGAYIATSTLNEMQTQRQLDERAWISLGRPGFETHYLDRQPGIYVQMNNTGKTPATIMEIRVVIQGQDIVSGIYRDILTTNKPMNAVIAPGNSNPIWVWEPDRISEAEFDLLQQRKIVHCFHFEVTYKDAFGYIRSTAGGYAVNGTINDWTNGSTFNIVPSCGESHMY